LHLSSGIIISVAHGYVWNKGSENKEAIFASLKLCLGHLQKLPETAAHFASIQSGAGSTMELPDEAF
jgi:hypothetical protein